MEKQKAIELLRRSGALLEGHFLLTSGNHSAKYIQCALLLAHPDLAAPFMEDIASHHERMHVDAVVAPAVGGIIVSFEVGRILGKRALFLEREKGAMTLRRGFEILQGEKLLIVEDVITTGSSVMEVSDVVSSRGGVPVAFASIVNRSEGRFRPGAPYYACVNMDIPIYTPAECPLCASGVPAVKPGSRGLA
jgi:orotate phosphoribosyltransferase